jgi:hypothetical protein
LTFVPADDAPLPNRLLFEPIDRFEIERSLPLAAHRPTAIAAHWSSNRASREAPFSSCVSADGTAVSVTEAVIGRLPLSGADRFYASVASGKEFTVT